MLYTIFPTKVNIVFTELDIDNNIVAITSEHKNFNKIVYMLIDDAYDKNSIEFEEEILSLINPTQKITNYIKEVGDVELEVHNNKLTISYAGHRLRLNNEIMESLEEAIYAGDEASKLYIDALMSFINKCYQNPIPSVVNQLVDFISACGFTIDADGDFYAYKIVRNDFKDIYSGTMDNSPGSVVEMPRFKVETDPDRTCAAGLHFAAWDYLGMYANIENSKVVLLKINPADVVSIPSDYDNMKGRACKYLVVKEVEKPRELDDVFMIDSEDDDVYRYSSEDELYDEYIDIIFNTR